MSRIRKWGIGKMVLVLIGFFSVAPLLSNREAFAFGERPSPWGKAVVYLPAGHRTTWTGIPRYTHHGGAFHRPSRYVVVTGLNTVVIGSGLYYSYRGVYYRKVPMTYTVVETPPAVVLEAPPPPIESPAAQGNQIAVIADQVNVRSGPGFTYPVVKQVSKGTILVIRDSVVGWWHVQLPDGQLGWVMAEFTTARQQPGSG